jgi:hypothetical protein
VPIELRARAHYLAGNLEFLRGAYDEAVRHYEEALKLIPGMVEAGDTVGQDAAWNRAIALFRKEEEKKRDAGSDAQPPPPPDGGKPDGGQRDDGGNAPKDSGRDDKKDAGGPNGDDGGQNQDRPDGADRPKPDTQDAGPPPENPRPNVNQDERMLDMLESAPTFQQQDAKNRASGRKFRGKADK